MVTSNDRPFDVTIIDDDVDEGTEYFEVHFFVDSQRNSGGYAFPSSIARVTIFDDDGGEYSIIMVRVCINEVLLFNIADSSLPLDESTTSPPITSPPNIEKFLFTTDSSLPLDGSTTSPPITPPPTTSSYSGRF